MTDPEPAPSERTCPWCAAPAERNATHCGACGAALAQRESIGDLVLPGLTNVDPWLKDRADQPLHIPKASPSQAVASGAIVAGLAGGPIGLAALGGLAAVAAAEYLGARHGDDRERLEAIGKPNSLAEQVVARLERQPVAEDQQPTVEPASDADSG